MATATLPAAGRLVLVVVARDIATGTLARVAAQTYRLRDTVAAVSKELQNLGVAWSGAFVIGGTALLGITKTFSDLETAVTFAIKRSSTLTKSWGVDFPQAVDISMRKIQDIAAETGIAGEEIADALNNFIASGFKAEALLGDMSDASAESAENLLFVTKAAAALGYSAEEIATTTAQIMNIYSAALKFKKKITTSFEDSSIALQDFSRDSGTALRGVLDELNYVTNTMRVNLDDITQVFQYAGGTIISTGTSLEDMLAIISQLILTGIAPGRIGRFLRSTAVDMDQLSVSTEKWAKALIKAFGLEDEKKEYTRIIKEYQKELNNEQKLYLQGQKQVLKLYQSQQQALEKLIARSKYLEDIKTAKSIEDLNKSTVRLLMNAGFTVAEIKQMVGNYEYAAQVIRSKLVEVQKKVQVQQQRVNETQKQGLVDNTAVFKTQMQIVKELLKEYEGIDWEVPKGLMDQLLTTDNLVKRWEVFKQILDSLPFDQLGEKGEAIRRILVQAFFGERWADLGLIVLSSLDPIKKKSEEIAKESSGSVEEEFEQASNTLQMNWNKMIETIKKNLLDVFISIKPEILDLFELIKSAFSDQTMIANIKIFLSSFIEGMKTAINWALRLVNILQEVGILGEGGVSGLGKLFGMGLFGGPMLMFMGTFGGFINNLLRMGTMIRGMFGGAAAGAGAATGAPTIPLWASFARISATPLQTPLANQMGIAIKGAAQEVTTQPGLLTTIVTRIYTFFNSAFSTAFSKLGSGMGSILGKVFGKIGGVFKTVFGRIGIIGRLSGLLARLGISLGGLGGAASGAASALSGFLATISAVGATISLIVGVVTTLAGVFTGFVEAITAASGGTSGLKGALEGLWNILKPVADMIWSVLNLLFQFGRWIGVTIVHGIYNMIKGFSDLVAKSPELTAVLNIVGGAFKGVAKAVGWLWDKIKGFIDWLTGKLKKSADEQLDDLRKASEGYNELGDSAIEAKEDVDKLYKKTGEPAPTPDVSGPVDAYRRIGGAARDATSDILEMYGVLKAYQRIQETITGKASNWQWLPGHRGYATPTTPGLPPGPGIPQREAEYTQETRYPWRGHRGAAANISIDVHGVTDPETVADLVIQKLKWSMGW